MNLVRIVTHHKRPKAAAKVCVRDGIIAVGWSVVGDLSSLTREEVKLRLKRRHPHYRTVRPGRAAGELLYFRDNIKIGDVVIAYSKNNLVSKIGLISSGYRFVDTNTMGSPDKFDYPHQRVVEWWNDIDSEFYRSKLREISLSGWLKLPGTILLMEESELREKLPDRQVASNTAEKLRVRLISLMARSKSVTEDSLEKSIDEEEQGELVQAETTISRDAIIAELRGVTPTDPELVTVRGKTYKRDNRTIALLKKLRNFRCQICDTTIEKKAGGFYVEAAHIEPKHLRGPEVPRNLLILCPNHHKEFDYGDKRITEHSETLIIFDLNSRRYEISLSLD